MGQPPVRILLAEDNDGDIFLVRRALDGHIGPYELLLAKDGEEALQVLERAHADQSATCPDFAILDLNYRVTAESRYWNVCGASQDMLRLRLLSLLRQVPLETKWKHSGWVLIGTSRNLRISRGS
jgi:CheY-like chemotaxis protein